MSRKDMARVVFLICLACFVTWQAIQTYDAIWPMAWRAENDVQEGVRDD